TRRHAGGRRAGGGRGRWRLARPEQQGRGHDDRPDRDPRPAEDEPARQAATLLLGLPPADPLGCRDGGIHGPDPGGRLGARREGQARGSRRPGELVPAALAERPARDVRRAAGRAPNEAGRRRGRGRGRSVARRRRGDLRAAGGREVGIWRPGRGRHGRGRLGRPLEKDAAVAAELVVGGVRRAALVADDHAVGGPGHRRKISGGPNGGPCCQAYVVGTSGAATTSSGAWAGGNSGPATRVAISWRRPTMS